HSSGSSRAAIPVEFTRSQNRTVKCRRSPVMDAGRALFVTIAEASTSKDTPQESQNFAVSRLSAPHWEQRILHPVTMGAALWESPRLVRVATIEAAHLKGLLRASFITFSGMGTLG